MSVNLLPTSVLASLLLLGACSGGSSDSHHLSGDVVDAPDIDTDTDVVPSIDYVMSPLVDVIPPSDDFESVCDDVVLPGDDDTPPSGG